MLDFIDVELREREREKKFESRYVMHLTKSILISANDCLSIAQDCGVYSVHT